MTFTFYFVQRLLKCQCFSIICFYDVYNVLFIPTLKTIKIVEKILRGMK